MQRRLFLTTALAAPTLARAQTQPAWPGERPIEIIVVVPPGGGLDALARLLAPHLATKLGNGARFVINNRGGAGTQIGNEAIFNAAPDGFTLGCITAPALLAVPIERQARYSGTGFSYLANVVEDPNAFWVRADSPFKSTADLLATARARPGTLSYGTTGVGGDDHIAMLAFEGATGMPPMVHAPFAGSGPGMQALLGGHLDLSVGNISESIALLREGKLRCLGVAATTRYPATPEVPTFREQGINLIAAASRGFVAPPGLPPAIQARLEAAFTAALAEPAFIRDAERAAMPLRPVVGAAYRQMMLSMDENLRALWQRRPWKEG